MLYLFIKKELRIFFKNKANLAFMFILPIAVVFLFSICLESYMDADYNTFKEGKLLYYSDNPSAEVLTKFKQLSESIQLATGITIEAAEDLKTAKEEVELSQAYGVITLSRTSFDYYRSPYNETEGGKIIRSLYQQFTALPPANSDQVKIIRPVVAETNSKVYYSFSGLAFVILYMAVLIANSTADERELKTVERIILSKAGVKTMFISKIVTGLICASVMTVIVYVFSISYLGVSWGPKIPLILAIFTLLALFSSLMGAVLGMICKNKSTSQGIILMINILCGYLGGALLPLSMLENAPLLNLLIKISPLYWINRSMAGLYNGIADYNTFNSIFVLSGLSVLILLLYFAHSKKSRGKTAI